ncbi:MAG TPA: hypothetical protein VKI44_35730 [Acetobacteraceae bacterium]|nr:hypothetical protein [Acetobacteraceae bacterium]
MFCQTHIPPHVGSADHRTTSRPFQLLPKAVWRTIVADLYAGIPPPTLTNPELIAERVHAAIATIASMCPVNAEEANIAARVVIADAQAKDSIRHARTVFSDPGAAMKCQAQASHMMRTANAARSLLLRVQAARHKRDAVQAAREQDAWTIHATEGLLLAADGQPATQPPPPPQAEPEPPPPPVTGDDDKFARYDAAEQYALLHPRRAAEIRAYGGVPPTATYGPPEPETVLALITSTSLILQQIDKEYAQAVPA